jgi:hypothetical protein
MTKTIGKWCTGDGVIQEGSLVRVPDEGVRRDVIAMLCDALLVQMSIDSCVAGS